MAHTSNLSFLEGGRKEGKEGRSEGGRKEGYKYLERKEFFKL
jgi:hypothetical protein